MDVIILGVYSKDDICLIEEVANINGLKIEWNYEKYRIEAEKGVVELKKYYKLYQAGILIEDSLEKGDTFYSGPLLNEISDYYISTEWDKKICDQPKLFNFFDSLSSSSLQKIIIAFADEWDENVTVKIEKLSYRELKSRLYSPFVWCFGYRDLKTNSEIRDEYHPLVLESENVSEY